MDKYNGENLEELFPPKWQLMTASFFPNKDLIKLFQIADMIEELSPDILMLVEVGGKESLENFNQYFLKNQYNILIEPSNSDRGIDLGYMIKKSLPLKAKLVSHTKSRLDNGNKFARGAFELQLYSQDKLVLINYLCHLKSKLNLKRNDFEGRSQRAAEVNYLVKEFKKKSNKFEEIPIMISGDLNGVIFKSETEEELKPLVEETPLLDVLEILDIPTEKRMTYCYFNRLQNRYPMQLDYILLDKKFAYLVDPEKTKIIGFTSPYIDTFEMPQSFQEKRNLPSDHFPVLLTINLSNN